MLQETTMRPIFGEDLVDHLNACKRKIAKPLALSIMSLLDGGLTDEGLFRIPTKQIKLDKVKAFMDTNTPLTHVLQVKYLNYRVSQQVPDRQNSNFEIFIHEKNLVVYLPICASVSKTNR